MSGAPVGEPEARQNIARVMRVLRQTQELRARDLARAMGLPLRTYTNLEAGRAAATPMCLLAFARLVDCDPFALLLCAGGLDPGVVLACRRNKAVSIAVGAIQDLHAGRPNALAGYTAAELIGAFGGAQRRLEAGTFEKMHAGPQEGDASSAVLTERQLECLRWAQAGKSSTDIGAIVGISHRTVEAHLAEACARLGVRTRIQAISLAIDVGLLSSRPLSS